MFSSLASAGASEARQGPLPRRVGGRVRRHDRWRGVGGLDARRRTPPVPVRIANVTDLTWMQACYPGLPLLGALRGPRLRDPQRGEDARAWIAAV
jgi:hypothetical protein